MPANAKLVKFKQQRAEAIGNYLYKSYSDKQFDKASEVYRVFNKLTKTYLDGYYTIEDWSAHVKLWKPSIAKQYILEPVN